MQFLKEQLDDIAIIKVPGDHLDADNAKEFKEDISELIQQEKKVVFDLSELRFVDSSGLGAIISCLRKLNESGGDLKLFGMNKSVRALFELVRLNRLFDILNTKDEAIKAFHI